jgi:hypothetical protein
MSTLKFCRLTAVCQVLVPVIMIGRQAKATASITHRSKVRAASDTGRPAPAAMPAAPSTASVSACSSTSASEWPSSPFS